MSNTQTQNPDTESREKREENFDAYYKKVVSMQEHLERIHIVTEQLENKYDDYKETKEFVRFLKSIEEVFAHAANEKWSVEKTESEMIKSEIYLLSQISGVDEMVFLAIYEEFTHASHDVEKIQIIAKKLMDKYTEDIPHYIECKEFIMYVRDALLVFAHSLSGEKAFDEVDEAKSRIIRLRMELMAADNQPPLKLLESIYTEFVDELKK